AHARTQVHLARVHGDPALAIDGDESVDLIDGDRFCCGCCRGPFRACGASRYGKRNDQRTARLEKMPAARESTLACCAVSMECARRHGALLPCHAMASDARRIARTMRRCVPQRQRLSASAARISSSVGLLLVCSSAAACMIMPLMQ